MGLQKRSVSGMGLAPLTSIGTIRTVSAIWCVLIALNAYSLDSSWWLKPSYQKKIREERQIVVSIISEDLGGQSRYRMTGAGVVLASRAQVLKNILAFEDLQKISSYFKKVVHQPEMHRAYFVLEAYGYEARLLIKYSIKDQVDKSVFEWSVVWGGFQGMIGTIELLSLAPEKTEAILFSSFDDKQIPLPKIFKGVVLEVIVQHVAKSMRKHIENKNQAQKGT